MGDRVRGRSDVETVVSGRMYEFVSLCTTLYVPDWRGCGRESTTNAYPPADPSCPMGDPVCYLAFCPACDAQVTNVDDECPDCGARLD